MNAIHAVSQEAATQEAAVQTIVLPKAPTRSLFAELSSQQLQKLRNFIHKRVMNPDDAEDLLQHTFVEALRSEEKFQHQCKPETWLCGIALNLIRNHFRKLYRQPAQVSIDDQLFAQLEAHHDVGSQVESHRELERTMQAMRDLPSTMRETLQVTLESDGSYQETADTLGVPIGTVRSRLSRAREQLRRQLPDGFRAA